MHSPQPLTSHRVVPCQAVASTADTTVQVLTRDALQSMQSQAPQLAATLEHALLKYLSFQVNAKLGISDGVSDAHFAYQ